MEKEISEDVNKDSSASESTQEVIDEAASAQVEPDWKELLRLEQEKSRKTEEERDNYREGLLSAKRREKIQKREQAAGIEDGEEDKIAKAVREALEPVMSTLQGSKVDQILASTVTDPSKREYVKSLLQNRIQRTGTSDEAIRSDIEAALALANASKFAKENEELKRMKDNRTYIPPNAAGGGSEKGIEKKVHKWTPEQEKSLEDRARANGIQDVEKYKEAAWKQTQTGTAFEARKKYL